MPMKFSFLKNKSNSYSLKNWFNIDESQSFLKNSQVNPIIAVFIQPSFANKQKFQLKIATKKTPELV